MNLRLRLAGALSTGLVFVGVMACGGRGAFDSGASGGGQAGERGMAADSKGSSDRGERGVPTVASDWSGKVDTDPGPTGDLPEGDQGIAVKYPGDKGIAGDPAVIFADDFESYGSGKDLARNWNAGVYHNAEIEKTSANVFAGAQSLRFTSPKQAAELSNGVARTVSPERDLLYLRWYSKFDPAFDVVGSSHNGGGISAHHYDKDGMATPGIPADGQNKFLIAYECWRGDEKEPNPGNLNVYVYHPEQRSMFGDHFFPNGDVMPDISKPGNFGRDFVKRPNIVPALGRWYAYEVMLRANTPGLRDGRIALWLDGKLIADFKNLRLRDIPSLTIDRFGLSLHIRSNTKAETRKWYDNVVAATSYIGPTVKP
jgi:hypothetical protein